MEKIITSKAASFIDMNTAKYILERADLRAASVLEQYRKSTDRNYTLASLVMTVFMALTAFLASSKPSASLILVTAPLWLGMGTALVILFCKVIWVHDFMAQGDLPSNIARDEVVDVAMRKGLQDNVKANDEFLHHSIISSIRANQRNTETNLLFLHQRCRYVRKAMTAIVASAIASTLMAAIIIVYRLFG